jgi:hypothetical protein
MLSMNLTLIQPLLLLFQAQRYPLLIFTHPSSTWTWTSICEGPNAIYYAGKNLNNSSIFKIGLTTGTTALGFPVLATPTEIAQFPVTESSQCYRCISWYLYGYLY